MRRQFFPPCQLLEGGRGFGGEPGTYDATVQRLPHKVPPVSPLPPPSSTVHSSTAGSICLQRPAAFVPQYIPSLTLPSTGATSSPPPSNLIDSRSLAQSPPLSTRRISWPQDFSPQIPQGFADDCFSDVDEMFHTFQGAAPRPIPSEQTHTASKPNAVTKRVTTPHACAECKRRKIRCDGRQPCGQCLGCRSPKPCYYDKHRQRVIPSRKTLDALSQSLEECRSILKRLYPTRDIQALLPLSRPQLISLLDHPDSFSVPSQASPTGTNTTPLSQSAHSPNGTAQNDDRSLANLEQLPSQDTEWDEDRRNREPIPAEADDVNALSLSVDRQSSYLSATSVKAAFIVMLKVAPGLRSYLAAINSTNNKPFNPGSSYPTPQTASSIRGLQAIPWSSDGQTLIDAYFNRVQILVPMLDEPSFRADYLSGRRSDAPWLALLNMVFAMGSIVARKSDDHNHIAFYNRAKDQLPIDSFGSGHLETLQALALMGGYYLHYINRPNMANAVSGAALRMACAMGLHRESTTVENGANQLAIEQRRRTWWSLFCLDTWAFTTTGRPSMGRWGPAITVRPPEITQDQNIIGEHTGILPLIENIKFCKISTQIQDLLAQTPLLCTEDRTNLDSQLVAWHDNLPWILRSTEPCPESVYTARCVMKWRYQNLRAVLYRPVLLNLAYCGTEGTASQEDLAAVSTCRAIAKQNIEDIAREWTPNQMLGWNGVWLMYQASTIPLLSLFWESWNTPLVRDCQAQIETVLEAFEGMADWSLAARRSREVLSKLYEASKRPLTRPVSPKPGTPGVSGLSGLNGMHGMNGMVPMNGSSQYQHMDGPEIPQLGMMEDGLDPVNSQDIWDFDGMLWGRLTEGLEMPFDGMTNMEFEDGPGLPFDGPYIMHQ